jgi:hypothetical protein
MLRFGAQAAASPSILVKAFFKAPKTHNYYTLELDAYKVSKKMSFEF